ncbi:carbohydrate ABC transporter membrane protein 1, CUT1 family [Halogeometricum borinquense DSM 11551]|uniref:Carbohydrate ABC transporter membrane protein 1, CUT1 family n=2 Tax=Halogeometricum borinquense (strain ATCC 700274 / DSM 11551 / JCM 10706 / KCTC 4070 / PR3) TaxID=469382 RepID=E4NQQ1_HALBP|nr:carbohydrate ABC transporter membrane protein 1, CUT1 family [Halogeometricum borinquense DSM 11551]
MATEQESGDTVRERTRTGPYISFIRWMESLTETQFAYFLLTPALLLLLVIAVYPLIQTFGYSLYADQLTGTARLGQFVGIENYVALFSGARDFALPSAFLPGLSSSFPFVTGIYSSALMVTLVFTAFSVLFETIIGFAQALILDQDFRGRRWVRVAIIIPWAVPIVIQGMIWFLMFQPNIGFLIGTQENPAILNTLGLSFTPLRNTSDSLFLIIVADVWKTTAFMALLILAGLQSIDRSLYDVARVAGASKWQQFKMITFPLILPTVLVAMLFRTIAAMRVYGIIETMAGCTTVPSLSCLVVTTFNNSMYGTSATVAFVTAGLIGIVVSVYIVKFADAEGGF